MTVNIDLREVMGGLKDFQRTTVEHAFHRLFDAPDSTHRFLVADEVGLGKTMVARGVIAKTIDRLQSDGVERIDIVYICSNGDIASQNVRKLDVTGQGAARASRLTLLATEVSKLRERRLNLIALTPGTSFEQSGGSGIADERVLLYWLLRVVWGFGNRVAPKNVFQGGVVKASDFRHLLSTFDRARIDGGIASDFNRVLEEADRDDRAAGRPPLRERFEALCDDFARARRVWSIPIEQRRDRDAVVGELRGLLAKACIDALEPDLVVLDEFQRFRHLLLDEPDNDAALLAQSLFNWERPGTHEHARVLMLSATPYRALTVAGDGGGDEHHEDFLATVRFLADSDGRRDELRELLRQYQAELYRRAPEGSNDLRATSHKIEALLTRYIARTERIGAAGQHDAMLRHVSRNAALTSSDIDHYLLAQSVADRLDAHDVTELWKSAPYLLSFLDGYQLRRSFDAACGNPADAHELSALLRANGSGVLDRDRISAYADVEPGNPRLRSLAADVIDTEAWRLLWVPPALPYHQLGGAFARPELRGFSKRLVFSSWHAVPRAAAGLLSYLAERRLVLEATPHEANTSERRSAQRNRLAFAVSDGRRTGMPALALLYPSPALAGASDPRAFATERPDATIDELVEWAKGRIDLLLAQLPAGLYDGPEDERWYWAAPLLLDANLTDWWSEPGLAASWSGGDRRASADDSRWQDHVELARATALGSLDPPLGRRPSDLADVVASLAIAAPGTVALRSLHRVTGIDLNSREARLPAARIAWALRGLFNSPEATSLLRRQRASREDTYWREVLRYATEGCLQAVLDEHAHVLREAEGVQNKPPAEAASTVADAMARALALRASRVTYSHMEVSPLTIVAHKERLHTAFATRFGDDEAGATTVDGEGPARASQLREAFNSPYWPFVLISTSVGQEGLDFHPYCHVVVHWNLPNNPVDLEQREGRVHRYKGHAVRKNVARQHGASALADAGAADPWDRAFAFACQDRLETDSELVPYWIYPLEHGAKVERHILALPLSRELDRFKQLRDALAVYRLAFGQARQEDVIEHLLERLGRDRAEALSLAVRIDLRPPAAGRSSTELSAAPASPEVV